MEGRGWGWGGASARAATDGMVDNRGTGAFALHDGKGAAVTSDKRSQHAHEIVVWSYLQARLQQSSDLGV